MTFMPHIVMSFTAQSSGPTCCLDLQLLQPKCFRACAGCVRVSVASGVIAEVIQKRRLRPRLQSQSLRPQYVSTLRGAITACSSKARILRSSHDEERQLVSICQAMGGCTELLTSTDDAILKPDQGRAVACSAPISMCLGFCRQA